MKTNYILAILALVGGLSAAFTNYSSRNNMYPTWKFDSDRIEGKKVEVISASHMADLLYMKDQGFVLLDARDEVSYAEYHIPTALRYKKGDADPGEENSWFILYGMPDEKIADLSDGLPGKVFVLKGGMDAWYSEVIFPDFLQFRIRNKNMLEQIIHRSRYFGGTPGNTQHLNINVRESRYREGC